MEDVMSLFELYWFNSLVLLPVSNHSPPAPRSPPSAASGGTQEEAQIGDLQFPPLRSLHHRSNSDSSSSPVSVLKLPKSETILSGKDPNTLDAQPLDCRVVKGSRGEKVRGRERRRKKKKESRSLSELEYEELRGFMDLGFVFPKEDIDPKLMSVVPGLQRWVDRSEEGDVRLEPDVSRPYLSEAWSFWKENGNPLNNWRVPASGDEIDMKDHLRCWALAVASTIR